MQSLCAVGCGRLRQGWLRVPPPHEASLVLGCGSKHLSAISKLACVREEEWDARTLSSRPFVCPEEDFKLGSSDAPKPPVPFMQLSCQALNCCASPTTPNDAARALQVIRKKGTRGIPSIRAIISCQRLPSLLALQPLEPYPKIHRCSSKSSPVIIRPNSPVTQLSSAASGRGTAR